MAVRLSTPASGFAPRIGRSVSLDDAAQLLGVSRRTIYNRIRNGRLQTVRTFGGSQRVLVDSLREGSTRVSSSETAVERNHVPHGPNSNS